MNKKREFVKNTLIISFGKISTQLIVFLLLPLYTAVLNKSEYGYVDLVLTYVSLLAPLVSLQLENALFRFLVDSRNDEDKKSKYITNVFYTLTIMFLLVSAILVLINLMFNIKYFEYLIILVMITMFTNMLLQYSRGIGSNINYSIGSMIIGISTVLFNILFLVVLKYGIVGMFISQILANILGIVYLSITNKVYKYVNYKNFDKQETKNMLKYSLPLIPNSVCWWVINVSDRTLISLFIDVGANGIYSVSNKFSNAFITVYNMVNLSWVESSSLHINDSDRDEFFSSMISDIFKLFINLAALVVAVMPFVFPILINKQYIDAYTYIPLLLVGSIFNVLVGLLSGVYLAKKLTKQIATTTLFSAILNILFNVMLIRYIGIWAAALSTVLAFMIMSIYRMIDVQKYAKIKLNYNSILPAVLLFILVSTTYYINNIYLNIFMIILSGVITVWINKNIILKLFKKTR